MYKVLYKQVIYLGLVHWNSISNLKEFQDILTSRFSLRNRVCISTWTCNDSHKSFQRSLETWGLHVNVWYADPLICKTTLSPYEVREVETTLKGRKASDTCNISAEFFKAKLNETEPWSLDCMRSWLPLNYLVLFLLTGKGGWSSQPRKRKETVKTSMLYCTVFQAKHLLDPHSLAAYPLGTSSEFLVTQSLGKTES